jgi:hypothetical protein
MANEFIIKNGFQSRGNGQVTGSLDVTGGITGSYTGSFTGDGSGLTGLVSSSYAVTASYALSSPAGTDTNFANTNLTFDGNRNHNTDGNDLFISVDGNFSLPTVTDAFLGIQAAETVIGYSSSAFTQYNLGGGFDIKHVGDTVLSGSLTLKGTAIPSTGETLQSWYVSDSTALVSLINATTTDNTFVPTIKSTQPAADNFTPFSWINEIGADTGTFPGLIFQVRSGSNQTVQNRDLFAFRNYTTDIVNIGTSTTTFNSSLVISGSMTYRTETVSSVADPTLSSLSHVVFYDTSGGAGGTITLPTAVSGKEILLIRTVGTNGATVSGGGGNINGSATQALPTTLYTTVKLISDGTNWFANTLTAL